jgi:hypothetical protein
MRADEKGGASQDFRIARRVSRPQAALPRFA